MASQLNLKNVEEKKNSQEIDSYYQNFGNFLIKLEVLKVCVYNFANSLCYKGDYQNGLRTGKGALYNCDGSITYEG